MKTPGKPYQEAVGSYDANGNIRTLQRNATLNVLTADNADLSIADFTYHYGDNANTLQSITEPDRTFRTYTYDKLGQMTKETEGDKSKFVVYDVTGKVTAVYADASYTQPLTTFQYDDRGFRLAKTTYDADKNYVAIQKTWYVRDASGTMVSTYEDDLTDQVEAKPTEVPVYGSGKIGLYKPAYGVTFYEVTDHLGNVRAVIGDDMTLTYTATMESDPETRDKELNQYGFTNLNSVSAPLFNTTPKGDAVCKVSYQARQMILHRTRLGWGKWFGYILVIK